LQEHDLPESALHGEKGSMGESRIFSLLCRGQYTAVMAVGGSIAFKLTCASVAFWKASKIFLSATTLLDFLSMAFQTTPYACADTQVKYGSSSEGGALLRGWAYPLAKLLLELVFAQHMLVYIFFRHRGAHNEAIHQP
jgi:hypothetical protein